MIPFWYKDFVRVLDGHSIITIHDDMTYEALVKVIKEVVDDSITAEELQTCRQQYLRDHLTEDFNWRRDVCKFLDGISPENLQIRWDDLKDYLMERLELMGFALISKEDLDKLCDAYLHLRRIIEDSANELSIKQ